jgi:putative ABC transport system ATP-binding protein
MPPLESRNDSAAEAQSQGPILPVLAVQGVTKSYRMGDVTVDALRGVDLVLTSGELVVLLGPSGSGKSTLLNILGGLDVPSTGRVLYRGEDLTQASDKALTRYRRESVGFVFQFFNLVPTLTARENVALVTDLATLPYEPEEALELVGLAHRLDHFPSQLSGGEQQRVAIARAIAKRPSILLCDEPTGALDAASGALVLGAIARINQELGTTTAVVTHNTAIADVADRALHLADGRIVAERRNERRLAPKSLQW